MSHHPVSRHCKAKYFVIGSIFTILLSASVGFGSKYRQDEREPKTREAGADIRKVKAFYKAHNRKLWDSLAAELATATVNAATAYRVPLEVQVGMNVAESAVYPFAQSRTGAKGLGQVDFEAWKDELPKGNPFEPHYNQEAAAYVLSKNIRRFGVRRGIEVYNLGEGNYKKGRRNTRYVNRVLARASEFRYFQER